MALDGGQVGIRFKERGIWRGVLVLASGSTCCCGQRVARIVVTLFAAGG